MTKDTYNSLCLASKIQVWLDSQRLIPRLLVASYAYLVWHAYQWFTGIVLPVAEQSALIVTVFGSAAAVIGLYTSSGKSVKTE